MASIGSQVRKAASSIDPIVTDYAVGYFNHLSGITFDAVQSKQVDLSTEVQFVSDLLIDAGASKAKVKELSESILKQLTTQLKENEAKLELTGDTSKRLLDINVLKSHNSKSDINVSLSMLRRRGR